MLLTITTPKVTLEIDSARVPLLPRPTQPSGRAPQPHS